MKKQLRKYAYIIAVITVLGGVLVSSIGQSAQAADLTISRMPSLPKAAEIDVNPAPLVALTAPGTYADDFSSGSYAGSSGNLIWSTNWTEVDDGSSTSGDIYVWTFGAGVCSADNCLRIAANNTGDSIERQADLDGAASAILSIGLGFSGTTTDEWAIEVSNDGVTYTEIDTIVHNGGATGVYPAQSVSIPAAYYTSTFRLRIRPKTTNGTRLYFDNVELTATLSTAVIGTVFNDANLNGVDDGSVDLGVAGIEVRAYDDSNAQVGSTALTDSSGNYVISGLTPAQQVRVEFTIPTALNNYLPSVALDGTQNTSVIFATGGDTSVDWAVHDPSAYCALNSTLFTTCFINGDPLPNGSSSGATDAVVSFYGDATKGETLGLNSDTGSVWGLAYEPNTGDLYMSAILKRHTGFGPGGPGAIYVSASATTTPTLFYNLAAHVSVGSILSNSARGLGTSVDSYNADPNAFPLIGKASLGDLDVSTDGNTLYVVNLHDRLVYAIDINNPSAAPTALPALPNPNCNLGVARPWALKYYQNELYVGVVCTGENGGSINDLSAHVYKYNGASWSASLLSFNLNFHRGCATYWGGSGARPVRCQWNPWIDEWSDYGGSYDYPQPILSDIEFDDEGYMLLGFMDRNGNMTGANQADTSGNGNYSPATGGDLLIAYNNNGTYELENNGSVGTRTTSGSNTNPLPYNGAGGPNTQQGPGGGEFYWQEAATGAPNFIPNANDLDTEAHSETVSGGLAVVPGSGEVVLSVMDPLRFTSGGVAWYSNINGGYLRGLELYWGTRNEGVGGGGYFGKAVGIGDVEYACLGLSQIEIGNRVWLDADNDGIQDPGEGGINGVVIGLYDSSNVLIATATTSGDGNYIFSSGTGTDSSSAKYGLAQLTNSTTGFEVRILNAEGGSQQAPLDGLLLSAADADADQRDSDGTLDGTTAKVAFDTGGPGANNHSYDFGFRSVEPAQIEIAKWVNTPPTVTVGAPISFTIRITNTGSSAITSLPLTDTYDTAYLTFDAVADMLGPNPANDPIDDGSIYWADVTDFLGDGQLDPGDPPLDIIVNFITKAETVVATAAECATAGMSYNKATALGVDACVEFPIAPAEAKLTLGDYIWHDIDNDGAQDANEPGINGVLVNLYEVTGSGNTLITTTTTINNGVDGFYQFDVVSGKDYQVEIDSSNFDPGGPLAGFVLGANQPNINNDADPDQTASNVTTNDDTLDFGFYCRFDLALVKTLAAGQPAIIMPGDDVTFTLAIFNQGVVTATNVTIADYIPTGFTLNDPNWTDAGGTATRTLAATLTPSGTVGASTAVDIVLTAGAALSGTYTNTAEIITYTSAITDLSGGMLPDADSTPDSTDGNGAGESTALIDDEVNQDGRSGGDEDDHDPAAITVQPPLACQQYTITLDGSQETPANASPATGSGWVQINPATNVMTYSISYGGLTGTESMAHIHGFAARGAPAGVLFSLPTGSPKNGVISYSEAQEADLLAGLAYFNIHTSTFGSGEIRGQIDGPTTACTPPEPSLAVSKTLNGVNPFGVGETISYTIRITNTGPVTLTVLPLEDRYSNVFLSFVSASVAPDVSSGNGILAWSDLTNALGDVEPGQAVSLDVTFGTLADTTLLTPVAPCTQGGHTPNIAQISGALADPDGDDGNTADDVAVVVDTDDKDCAEVQILNPTGIQLAERTITQTPAGVLVRWQMVDESNVTGFYIWKANGVDSSRRSELIPTGVNGQAASAAAYEWLDAGATLTRGDAYVLEIVKVDGATERVVIDVITEIALYLPLLRR